MIALDFWRGARRAGVLALCSAASLCAAARAADLPARTQPSLLAPTPVAEWSLTKPRPAGQRFSVSAYAGQWTNSRLPTFPYNLVTGRLTTENAQIYGALANWRFFDFSLPLPGAARLDGFSLELEGGLFKHGGRQDHVEGTAALVLRSGQIPLFSGLSLNLAMGNGLSYAFSRPAFELGPTGVPGVGSRRLQYHMSFEAAFSHENLSQFELFARLHHRSGIYGVISPRRTGSNYIGGGLRFWFR